jgi:hypothetical protein
LYAAEINVVRTYRLWPRSLINPPKTDADRRAYEAYADTMQYQPQQEVTTTFRSENEDSSEVHDRIEP